ncbi:MAG: hypothetical protein QGG64_24750 [Candidatus Latescibacteria bacterium]|jgi:hypothetical protein|nr:hypothetical protein [Candidatus Latescibacterota bacterium]
MPNWREPFEAESLAKVDAFIATHPEYTREGVDQPRQGNTNYILFSHRNNELVVFKVFVEDERKARECFAIRHWQDTGIVPRLICDVNDEMIVMSHVSGRGWRSYDLSEEEKRETYVAFGKAFGTLTNVPLSKEDRTFFESNFHGESNTVEAYLGRTVELGRKIQSRDPDFADNFWKKNLDFIEAQFDTLFSQPRILYNQDPGNHVLAPKRFMGFFDLEMCYVGCEAMQLGSMLNMLDGNKDAWQAIRQGFETEAKKSLTPEDLKAIAAMYHLLCWRVISRYMTYDGTGTGQEWTSPANPQEYRKKIESIEAMLFD